MPSEIHLRDERKVIADLVLGLFRLSYTYREDDRWGSNADEIVVLYSVVQATLEGRLVGPYKIAQATGIPLATVSRKLDRLAKNGVIVKRARGHRVPPAVLHDERTIQAVTGMIECIKEACAALSKMEAKPLVPGRRATP